MRTRKKNRNSLKNPDPLKLCERQPVGPIPKEIATRILTEPKNKLSGAQRRRLSRSRAHVVLVPLTSATPEPIKFANRLARLSIGQVNREVKKSARRAATAKYLLAGPLRRQMRTAVEAAQSAQLHRLKQAIAEGASRIKSR